MNGFGTQKGIAPLLILAARPAHGDHLLTNLDRPFAAVHFRPRLAVLQAILDLARIISVEPAIQPRPGALEPPTDLGFAEALNVIHQHGLFSLIQFVAHGCSLLFSEKHSRPY